MAAISSAVATGPGWGRLPKIGVGVDVTGGMKSKVEEMLSLVEQIPNLDVQIFSGEEAGNVKRALIGELLGTLIVGGR